MKGEKYLEELKKCGILEEICSFFNKKYNEDYNIIDTSHGENDIRINIIFPKEFVIKINLSTEINEGLLCEINRTIDNYNRAGIYAPHYLKGGESKFIYDFILLGRSFSAYVEEFAKGTVCEQFDDRIKLDALIGMVKYMKEYSGKDLMDRRSMWSIIKLPFFSNELDEKEENLNSLITVLRKHKENELADLILKSNDISRKRIEKVLPELRECSIQGDLNSSNILLDEKGDFLGLIDFNLSGTEVNINNILNETRYELKEEDFESYSSLEINSKMEKYRQDLLEKISPYYSFDKIELSVYEDYRKIIDTSLWPYINIYIAVIEEGRNFKKVMDLLKLINGL